MLGLGLNAGWVLGAACAALFSTERDVVMRWVLIPANHESDHMVPVEGDWALPCVDPTFLGKGKYAALLRPTGHPVLIASEKIAAADLPHDACSIEAWVAVDVYAGWGGFLSVLEDNGAAETGLMLGTKNDKFTFGVSSEGADDGDGKLTYLNSKEPFDLGRWYHVVGTYDGETQSIYVNGELQGRSLEQHGPIKYRPQHIIAVGGYVDSDENYPLTGALYEVALSDVCLSKKTVERRYKKGRGGLPEAETRTFTTVPLRAKPPLPELQAGINLAIDRGVQGLLREQLWDGSWEENADPYRNGATGLALYTLLRCGLKADHPAIVRATVAVLNDPDVDIATAVCAITEESERDNPNVVKAVLAGDATAASGRALYFSRETVLTGPGDHFHHIGLYAYRRAALERFVTLPASPLEQREKLEQLRALEAGMRIDAARVDTVPLGVDTPADLERARALLA